MYGDPGRRGSEMTVVHRSRWTRVGVAGHDVIQCCIYVCGLFLVSSLADGRVCVSADELDVRDCRCYICSIWVVKVVCVYSKVQVPYS